MIEYIFRQFKRLLVLAPGLALAYISAAEVYPILHSQIPAWIAILLTYIIAAYVLIPASARVIRAITRPKHIPNYSVTPDGYACDPVNIGLIGTQDQVVAAMHKAGWSSADERSIKTVAQMVLAIALRRSYATAPFSNLYLFGRKQDLGFQKSVDGTPLHRHHVRFWASTYTSSPEYHGHVHFWHKLHKDEDTTDDIFLWVGAASLDVGLGVIRHNGQLTHMIHHDTNAERELIVDDLRKAKQVKKVRKLKAGEPYTLQNRVIGGEMRADGNLTVVELA